MFFFTLLASTWIKPKICDNLKNKIQVFENEMFLQVFFFFFFFMHLDIDMVNIPI
jgi:hypothetical protein